MHSTHRSELQTPIRAKETKAEVESQEVPEYLNVVTVEKELYQMLNLVDEISATLFVSNYSPNRTTTCPSSLQTYTSCIQRAAASPQDPQPHMELHHDMELLFAMRLSCSAV